MYSPSSFSYLIALPVMLAASTLCFSAFRWRRQRTLSDAVPISEPVHMGGFSFDDTDEPCTPHPPPEDREIPPDTLRCPRCDSPQIETRHHARKAAGTLGMFAGTASGLAIALSGAEIGAEIGLIGGPAGVVCGAISGAIIAALVGGTAGCAAGAAFGDVIDTNVLQNHRCLSCGHAFSKQSA